MRLFVSTLFALSLLTPLVASIAAQTPAPRTVPPLPAATRTVDAATMQRLYDEVKTPYKYGVIIKGESPDELVDCPNVFRHGAHWYMMYVSIKGKTGYQTHLARSDDLLHWTKIGTILSHTPDGNWDAWQAGGGVSLYDTIWGGSNTLGTHQGKYWLSYIGGALPGYEPDPLAIGLASTDDPTAPREWMRLTENPVLHREQPDVRHWENITLYKSAVIRDEKESLGWPFLMFYNGKSSPDGQENIGLAVSRDLRTWHRMGNEPVIHNVGKSRWAITGDPQIAKIGDVWVMFYFGAFWKPNAFDTFAASYDLAHWTKWEGSHLIEPSEPYDNQLAHKPWVIKHDGVVYHFYCAVSKEGRVIALATSKDLKFTTVAAP